LHIAIKAIIALAALSLLFLGTIFLIAGGTTENYATGGAMVLIGFGLFGFLYYDSKLEADRPVELHAEYNVTMGGSGEFQDKRIDCPSCGAPVEAKDVTLMSGGLVIKCPYCGTTSAMEEQPKW
jgi:DNA-directed RNA polymerase subunit RPC12/RpoP